MSSIARDCGREKGCLGLVCSVCQLPLPCHACAWPALWSTKAGQCRAWLAGSCDASGTSSPPGKGVQLSGAMPTATGAQLYLQWAGVATLPRAGHTPALVGPAYPSLGVDGAFHLQFLQRAGACTRPQGPRGGSGAAVCVLPGSSPRGPMGICTSMGCSGVCSGGADPNPAHSARRQLLLSLQMLLRRGRGAAGRGAERGQAAAGASVPFPVGSLPARAPGSAGSRAGSGAGPVAGASRRRRRDESGVTRVAEPRRGEEAAPAARCPSAARERLSAKCFGFSHRSGRAAALGCGSSPSPGPAWAALQPRRRAPPTGTLRDSLPGSGGPQRYYLSPPLWDAREQGTELG